MAGVNMEKKTKAKAANEQPLQRVKCDLLGDVHRLRFEPNSNRMVADVLLSPTDVERLLKAMHSHYAVAKTKRGQRIAALSEELAKLVYQDCGFFVEGAAYVSGGHAIRLTNDEDFLVNNPPLKVVK